jgi:hypothetical protein
MMGGYGGMAGMMRGMGMGGMMGAADPSAPVMGPGVIAMQPKGSGRVVAHSSETGGWRAYPVPEGITASPIIAGSGLALHLEGERIPEVAAYSVDKGEWNVKELVEPAEGQASPIVMQQVVMYPIGRRLYAFSILTGTWDTLELDEAVQPIVENYRAWVQDKDRLWVFTAKTGKWSTFDPGTWTELKLEGSGGGVRP